MSYYRHRYKLEKMCGDLNDTLPLSTNNYNQEVIEISDDDEGTYYGSDFSLNEDSSDDSIQILCEIRPESLNLQNLHVPKTISRAIILELLEEMIQ